MTRPGAILALVIIASACVLLRAEEQLRTLSGSCSISATTNAAEVDLRLERAECGEGQGCGSTQAREPVDAFLGFTLADLAREGAHVEAVIRGEAGTLSCSGGIHDGKMNGDFRFVPDAGFAARMVKAGYSGVDSEKLQAFTLFRVGMAWIHSLETAGVTDLTVGNLIALRIFHADAEYVRGLEELGYPVPSAGKLVALKVHRVNVEEVKEVRALGYQPTLDELVQMRIFRVTPDFIRRMQARGLKDLTISKLVQVRIFQLAD
jgi:hypothetical protein